MLRIDCFLTNNWYNQTQNDIHMNLENPAFLHIAQCMISYNFDISSAKKLNMISTRVDTRFLQWLV